MKVSIEGNKNTIIETFWYCYGCSFVEIGGTSRDCPNCSKTLEDTGWSETWMKN